MRRTINGGRVKKIELCPMPSVHSSFIDLKYFRLCALLSEGMNVPIEFSGLSNRAIDSLEECKYMIHCINLNR